jgi:phospholipid-binding lipoprotein MlaA
VGTLIEEAALDKYSFTREAHLQRRRAAIIETKESDGSVPREGEPATRPPGEAARPAPDGSRAPGPAPAR